MSFFKSVALCLFSPFFFIYSFSALLCSILSFLLFHHTHYSITTTTLHLYSPFYSLFVWFSLSLLPFSLFYLFFSFTPLSLPPSLFISSFLIIYFSLSFFFFYFFHTSNLNYPATVSLVLVVQEKTMRTLARTTVTLTTLIMIVTIIIIIIFLYWKSRDSG